MNVVRARQHGQLGQDSGILSPYQSYGSIDNAAPAPSTDSGWTDFPFPLDTSTTTPAPSVPKPGASTGSPIYATFGPYGTLDPTAVAPQSVSAVPAPAPRVNVPGTVNLASSSFAGIPLIALIGIGIVGVLALSGGRRRR